MSSFELILEALPCLPIYPRDSRVIVYEGLEGVKRPKSTENPTVNIARRRKERMM